MFKQLPNVLIMHTLPTELWVDSKGHPKKLNEVYDPAHHVILVLDSVTGLERTWGGAFRSGEVKISLGEIEWTALVFTWAEVIQSGKNCHEQLQSSLEYKIRRNGIDDEEMDWLRKCEKITSLDIEDTASAAVELFRSLGAIRLTWERRYGNATLFSQCRKLKDARGYRLDYDLLSRLVARLLPRWKVKVDCLYARR